MGWTGTHYYGPLKTARDKRILIYGNSNTVQPNSYTVYYIIKIK